MSTVLTPSKLEASIDKKAAGEIAVSKSGMVVESMAQVMEIAKLMALGREAIPKHLRDNPGACLSVAIQAYEWQISPFALANKTYVVNDRLAYEASLYQAVVTRRAPIKGRIKMGFKGDGPSRECRVWAELRDGTGEVDYTSPKFATIKPKNSPLWVNDPDQQLYYFSVRAFARRHFPDVMMGIYTVDEILDDPATVTVVDQPQQQHATRSAALAAQLAATTPEPKVTDVEPAKEPETTKPEETNREPGDDAHDPAPEQTSQVNPDDDAALDEFYSSLGACQTMADVSELSATYMKHYADDEPKKTAIQVACKEHRETIRAAAKK